MVSQTCPCCKNRGYSLNDSYSSDDQRDSLQLLLSWQGPRATARSSEASPVWQGWLTPERVVITTNLAAETSHKGNEYCCAVWNACRSAWGWPALEWGLLLASSVRLLLCNQQVLSCNEREGRQQDNFTLSLPHSTCFTTLPYSSFAPTQVVYSTVSHFICLSSSFIPQLRICSSYPSIIILRFIFTKYFSPALSLIIFPFHASLRITYFAAVSLLSLPYFSATLAWAARRQNWSYSSHNLQPSELPREPWREFSIVVHTCKLPYL